MSTLDECIKKIFCSTYSIINILTLLLINHVSDVLNIISFYPPLTHPFSINSYDERIRIDQFVIVYVK